VGNTLFALVWVLNFAISVWNAYAVGKVWIEARIAGGWHRFMCWIGAVMSACGFTWCYLSFLALTAHHFQWLTEEQVRAGLNLGYVLLLPFILFGGYALTLDSWAQAFRRGGFLNYGAAAWNTYATIHNTYAGERLRAVSGRDHLHFDSRPTHVLGLAAASAQPRLALGHQDELHAEAVRGCRR